VTHDTDDPLRIRSGLPAEELGEQGKGAPLQTGQVGRGEHAWALLVTDGTILEFPPELYLDHLLAVREARRWAESLAMGDPRTVRQPFEGRWEVGHRDIRLAEVDIPRPWPGRHPWVGTHWTSDGYPDPEATLLAGRDQAKRWVESPLRGISPHDLSDQGYELVAVFQSGEDEEYSRATRLKQVSDGPLS
jgi:hypothetical protein